MSAHVELAPEFGRVQNTSAAVSVDRNRIKRILHVTEAPLGGVVSCLEELVTSQVDRNIESIEVITSEINRNAIKKAESKNLFINTIEFTRGSLRSLISAAHMVVTSARRTRPDIIHAHSSFAGIVVRCGRLFLPSSTKVVYCPHAWAFTREGSKTKNRLVALMERALSHFCDAIVCVSAYEKTEAIAAGIPESKLHVIENGISIRNTEYSTARKPADSRKIVAFVGRFDRQKGFDVFIEVMRRLPSEARGIVIGSSIVNSPEEYDIPENVELLGWQPRERVLELYRQADLLFMPSRWEGFPLVPLEAMQAGLAVFSSRAGGLQDIIVDHETGRLFDVDDVDEIVDAIRETSLATLESYGRKGYDRCRSLYTAERMNEQLWDLYQGLLVNRR
jgi:glycosyltransferase involved in cell wall biosynthesis